MSVKISVAVVVVGGFLGWAYTRIKPPSPRICGSPGGPPITSSRVQLNDGRHLSYREWGVSKDEAKYKVIVVHGFDTCKDLKLPLSQVSQTILFTIHIFINIFNTFFIRLLLFEMSKMPFDDDRNLLRSCRFTFSHLTEQVMERAIHIQNARLKVKRSIFKN